MSLIYCGESKNQSFKGGSGWTTELNHVQQHSLVVEGLRREYTSNLVSPTTLNYCSAALIGMVSKNSDNRLISCGGTRAIVVTVELLLADKDDSLIVIV